MDLSTVNFEIPIQYGLLKDPELRDQIAEEAAQLVKQAVIDFDAEDWKKKNE